MIPITRKELYLNKIVGNNDYETPEKPITIEEFFFAEILGEAVQAPEPLTRYQIYLAKIAGRNIEIPYPETRLEYFLARAAGMDISTPVPITKEEIYWSNYTAIVEFEFEGVPPLTYKAIEGTLKNYRIYGQTVDGESVGDLVTSGEHAGEYRVPVTVSNGTDTLTTPIYLPEPIKMVGDEAEYIDYSEQKLHRVRKNLFDKNSYKVSGYVSDNGTIIISDSVEISTFDYIVVTAQKRYSFKAFSSITPSEYQRTVRIAYYDKNKNYLSRIVKSGAGLEGFSFETPVNCQYIRLSIDENLFDNMLVKGNLIPIEYEPFIEDTELDVTLPALSINEGTNTLSIGTEVQPSKVYIKGEFKRITTTYVQSIEPDNTNNKIIFVVRAYRSKNDRIVRTGLVATNDPAIGVNINVNSTVITSGCKVFVKEAAGVTPTTDNIKYTWTKTKVTDGEIWYVRSYVEYINSDNEQLIIYSDAAKASLDGII